MERTIPLPVITKTDAMQQKAQEQAQEQTLPNIPTAPVSTSVTITSTALSVLSGQMPLTSKSKPVLVVTGGMDPMERTIPLPVVTKANVMQQTPLHEVTKQGAIPPLTDASSTQVLPVVTKSTQPKQTTKWRRILNRQVENVPTISEKKVLEMQDPNEYTDVDTDSTKYYEVMNPEQDDVFYLSHTDIMSRRCSVKLDKLTDKDINILTKKTSSSSSVTKTQVLLESPKKKRKISH